MGTAIARQDGDGISLNVHPAFIRKGHPLANVGGAYNAVYVRGNCVGDVMFYGQGAGSLPTASAVVSDVMNVILHCNINITALLPAHGCRQCARRIIQHFRCPGAA